MSENETDSLMEVDEAEASQPPTSIPIVGPVSPNRNLGTVNYSPLFSSSDSDADFNQNITAINIAQSLESWHSALRTVPATTDLTTSRASRIIQFSRSPSASSLYSVSPSNSISQLIDERSARLRQLRMLNTYINELQNRIPRGSRIRRRRRNRRRSVHFEEDDHDVPPSACAEVMRRGNSVSDCSQCSSDEEANANTVPSHLVEWSYPPPN